MSPDNQSKPNSLEEIASQYEQTPSTEQVLDFRNELEKLLQAKGHCEYITQDGKTLRRMSGKKFKVLKFYAPIVVGENTIPFLAFRDVNKKSFKEEDFYVNIGMSLEGERVILILSPKGKAYFDYLTRPILPLFNSYRWQLPTQSDLDLYQEAFRRVLNSQKQNK